MPDAVQPPPALPPERRDAIVAKHAAPSLPAWRDPVILTAAAVVATALVILVLWVRGISGDANNAANKACTKGDERGPCIAAAQNQAGLAQANQKLQSVGVAPVSTPAQVPVPTVTKTVTAPPAPPSQGSIESAVASYCSRAVCGSGPSAAQVAQAVATYCSINGKCRGPAGLSGGTGASGDPGASGSSGQPGANGTDGAAGQNATSDQVAAAVASYCADHNQCQGPPGADGHDGRDGADGQPPVSWTYTDPLGGSHTCVRSDPFEPTAPTYTCN